MTRKKTKFDKKLAAILAGFIVIAAVFLVVGANNARIFDPADNTIAANTTTIPQSVTQEGKETKDFVEKLKKEGFTEKDVSEALSLAIYVENKLTGICQDSKPERADALKPEAVNTLDESNSKEDLTVYKMLAEKFDVNTSIELMVKMKKDLGSIGDVMDEYLFSLQAEINLKDYTGKITEYRNVKKEKIASMLASDIITTRKIDEKLLEKLQKQNQNTSADEQTNINGKLPRTGEHSNVPAKSNRAVPIPKVPKPKAPNQPGTDNNVNIPDTVRPGANRSGVSRPAVPGQNNGVLQSKTDLP